MAGTGRGYRAKEVGGMVWEGETVKEVLGRGEWQERSDWGKRVMGRVLITGKEG